MSDFQELLGIDSNQTIQFFLAYLKDEITSAEVTSAETVYVASILAHYAQTSRYDTTYMSPSGSLYDILDDFVLPTLTNEASSGLQDPEILEVAGSQTLLLVGFFRDQMKKTHNLGWYDSLGRSFFSRAGNNAKESKKRYLLYGVAEHFPLWAVYCRNMNRTLRDERYLLRRVS
jgi:hypothetical protein